MTTDPTARTELRRNEATGQSAQRARQASSDQVGQKIGRGAMRVNEIAVREALRRARRDATALSGDAPAALIGHLIQTEAVRALAAPAVATIPVVIFAAVLAASQAEDADPTAIATSAALADALAAEIRGAASDRDALARLFAEFRDHV